MSNRSLAQRERLKDHGLDEPLVIIVDVRMPGASGLGLQEHLGRSGDPRPIIFLTGYGNVPMTVQAMKSNQAGAWSDAA